MLKQLVPHFDFTNPLALFLFLLLLPVISWYRHSIADMPSFRRKAVFVIRLIIVILIILSLAGFRFQLPRNELSVLFLVDASLSISPENKEWALEYIREKAKNLPKGDTIGVIVFGKDAYLEENLSKDPKIVKFSTITSPLQTNISGALQLATAVFPESSIKRIVLISDGNENAGDSGRQALVAAARGVEIRCLPYPEQKFNEVLVSSLESPGSVSRGEPFGLKMEVESSTDTKGTINIFRNNQLIAKEPVEVFEGKNIFTISQNVDKPGNYQYRASIETAGDKFPNNNQSETLTIVEGHPRVLYLCTDKEQLNYIPKVLEGRNYELVMGDLTSLPVNLSEMSEYQSVVFDNLNGLTLSFNQLKMIENYVMDLGGGFVMIGGDKSFGAGGYYKTPVEKILPVDLDIRKKKNLPSVAMVLCIDKSGSMGESTSGVEKIQLAREAAIATVDLLGPSDKVGIIGFDSASKWVSTLQYASNKREIISDIASLRAGGGTDIYPALDSAFTALKDTRAVIKHVILLTDGRSAPADYEKITKEMLDNKITVSTIGVGRDADMPFLEKIARWGQGRVYYTDEASMLPRIFVRESILAGRAAIVEETFIPRQVDSAEFLKGIDLTTMPRLFGYAVTVPKNMANLVMQTHQKDPLLAYWRVGLGKSVAFTSDDGFKWGKEWVKWKGYSPFWSQLIRWTLPQFKSEKFAVNMEVQQNTGRISVDSIDDEGKPLNFQTLSARIIAPSGKTETVPLIQNAAGRYEGKVETPEVGTYFVNIIEEVKGETNTGKIQAFSVPYSPEYKKFTTDKFLLNTISSSTGGKVIEPGSDIFDRGKQVVYYPRAAWMEMLMIALLLFPLDVALRRVYLPEDFWSNIYLAFQGKKPEEGTEILTSMDVLKMKKDTLREEMAPEAQDGDFLRRIRSRKEEKESRQELSIGGKKVEVEKTVVREAAPVEKKIQSGDETTGTIGRLKKLKKKIKDGDGGGNGDK